MSNISQPDRIDRRCFIARSGKPHNPAIADLTETHSLPATTGYLLRALAEGRKDPDTCRILQAIQEYRDTDPDSPTFCCYRWFVEDPAINDTNASFFICTSLIGIWLGYREALTVEEETALRGVFEAVLPWFQKMSESPSLFYPNKCISDAAMLLAAGHILGEAEVLAAGRDFVKRYFDYYARRGTGWGEDHSPVYITVILEMTLLVLALEESGPLADAARAFTDSILEWVAFHDGHDAVPSIRGYNFDANMAPKYHVRFLIDGAPQDDVRPLLQILQDKTGYHYTPAPLTVPRQKRWRTFDAHFSTTYVGKHARLGTLSHYPLMPNTAMHDSWGLGWQSKPCSFMVPGEEYGILQWVTEDDEGIVRQHEASGTGMHDWASRALFKRIGFHPETITVGHQDQGASIVFREIHHLHSPTRYLADRWRLAHDVGELLIDGKPWDGTPMDVEPQWLVLRSGEAVVALYPLQCRGVDAPDTDGNPQRRLTGNVRALPMHLEKEERGVFISLPLVHNGEETLTQHLLFSGWCVVVLDRIEDVKTLVVEESLRDDGELPRTYGELIRQVELTTPYGSLTLIRDMLTGDTRRLIDGKEFRWQA